MTDLSKPVAKINPQVKTNAIITSDGTLVNDPVKLVNDTGALVGGQTTPIGELRIKVIPDNAKGSIKLSR